MLPTILSCTVRFLAYHTASDMIPIPYPQHLPSTSCHSTPQSPFTKSWSCELSGKSAEVHVRVSCSSVEEVCESLTVHKSVKFSKYIWTCVVISDNKWANEPQVSQFVVSLWSLLAKLYVLWRNTILTLCSHKDLLRILSFYFRGHNIGFRKTHATTASFADLSLWNGKAFSRIIKIQPEVSLALYRLARADGLRVINFIGASWCDCSSEIDLNLK
jgi:hypothetical protein